MKNRRLWIFDLDGTLVNSIGGIVRSVNVTREQYSLKALPSELIISFTGDGVEKLTLRSFNDAPLPAPLAEIKEKMTANYAADPLYNTFLYEGVFDTLKTLYERGDLLAVVSNKPQKVSEKILAGLGVMPFLCENIGGGGIFPLKPAPDAIYFLLEKYSVTKENAVMAGDNHTDINCAAASGIKSIFCKYGFGEKLDLKADFEIGKFADLLHVF